MKMLKITHFLFFFFLILCSCAHKKVSTSNSVRIPAQAAKKSCFKIISRLFKSNKVSRQLKKEIESVAEKFGNDEGQDSLRILVDRLQDESAGLENEALEESWLKMRAIYTRYSEKVSEGHSDFSALKTEFKEVSDEFVLTYSTVRRPKVENTHQERLEMYRSLIDRPREALSQFEEEQVSKEFRRYIAYKDFVEDMSYADKDELKKFSWWAQKNIEFSDYRSQRFESLYRRKREEFRKSYKKMTKAEKENLEFSGKEASLKKYNELAEKVLSIDSNVEVLKEDVLLLLKTFGDLEPRFQSDDFLVWLFKEDKLSRSRLKEAVHIAQKEEFPLKLGDFLRQSYNEFAPFQSLAPIVKKKDADGVIDKVKSWLPTFKKEAPECESLDCVMARTTKTWKRFFGLKYYKDSLSCLGHNPVVLKSMAMDVGIVWSTLYWHYRNNEEEYQRFPYEILVNGAVFAPILAEANCRASFKSSLPFGSTLPKSEVFTSKGKRFTRNLKHFRGIAFKGFISSIGLIAMTSGADHLMLAMGHSIAKPLALNDMLILLPITYLYHGAWMGLKNMAVVNPLRHKILPRIAKIIQRKRGVKGSYWPLQTGLDFALFKGLLLYNSWDYLFLYQDRLLPFVMGSFSAGVTLEHNREITKEGETLDTFEGVSEAGVKTETVLSEEGDQVKLESIEVDVKDDVLESWVDQMLQDE